MVIFIAQSSSDAAATGVAGLVGMLGLAGFLVALVYSILLFFLPFMVWGCLRRLTSIRDDIRALRSDIKTVNVTPPLSLSPSLTGLVKNNEPISFTFRKSRIGI